MKLGRYLEGQFYCYLMHLNYGTGTDENRKTIWEFGKNHRMIGLDLSDVNQDWNTKTQKQKEEFHREAPNWFDHFEKFCNSMTKNDSVIIVAGHNLFLGLGRITTKDYQYNPRLKNERKFFDHTRKVEWEIALDYDNRVKLGKPLKGFNRTLLRITPNHKYWKILENLNITIS